MVQSPRQTSYLGLLALFAGAAGLVLTRFNPTKITTVTIGPVTLGLAAAVGAGALLLASIAFLAAATSGKTRTGVPMLAMLLAGGATVLAFYPGLLNRLHQPKPQSPAPTAITPTAPGERAAPAPADADESANHRTKTLFDMDSGSSSAPRPEKKEQAGPAISLPSLPPTSVPPAAPIHIDTSVAIRAAKTKLDVARAGVVASLQSAPAYQEAKAESDQAEADLRTAQLRNAPGTPELISAHQAVIEAHGKLQKLINDGMANEPSAQEASKELRSLQGAR